MKIQSRLLSFLFNFLFYWTRESEAADIPSGFLSGPRVPYVVSWQTSQPSYGNSHPRFPAMVRSVRRPVFVYVLQYQTEKGTQNQSHGTSRIYEKSDFLT